VQVGLFGALEDAQKTCRQHFAGPDRLAELGWKRKLRMKWQQKIREASKPESQQSHCGPKPNVRDAGLNIIN